MHKYPLLCSIHVRRTIDAKRCTHGPQALTAPSTHGPKHLHVHRYRVFPHRLSERYLLTCLLGRGGFSEVYKVRLGYWTCCCCSFVYTLLWGMLLLFLCRYCAWHVKEMGVRADDIFS